VDDDSPDVDALRLASSDVAVLLRAGQAAPSIHNTQPWLFAAHARQVDVWVDRRRMLPATDPDGRQGSISCGAAVFNLRLAMPQLGYRPTTTLRPEPEEGDLFATVAAAESGRPERWETLLYQVLYHRHTNRGPYRPVPVPRALRAKLVAAAEAEGGRLEEIGTRRQRQLLADLVVRGIRWQSRNPQVRSEFLRWTKADPRPEAGTPALSWINAPYTLPAILGRHDLDAAEAAELAALVTRSTLYLFTSDSDSILGWLQAGQALQRVLLTAAAHGLAVSFLNQPIESPDLRAGLADLAGSDRTPQMLLRVGYAATPALRTGRLAQPRSGSTAARPSPAWRHAGGGRPDPSRAPSD